MWKSIIFVLLLAYLGSKMFCLWLKFDFHRTEVFNHRPGPCKLLPNMEEGSEDMAEIPGDKVVITSGFRFVNKNKDIAEFRNRVPKVFMFDFKQPDLGAQTVAIRGFRDLKDCDFHGISSWVDKDSGEVSIFIVNHLEDESVVEIFTFDDQQRALTHQQTAGSGDPNFRFLNDLAAVGPRQFYVTNMLHTRSTWEYYLMLAWGSVTYFDGTNSKIASKESFHSPNGISASPDGKYFYMSGGATKLVYTLTRNPDNTLEVFNRHDVGTTVDNFYVDQKTGDVWAACHYVGHKVIEYATGNISAASPSQVLRLKMNDGRVDDVTEVLMDDGKAFPGSSVAVYKKNKLLVGSVFTKALLCDVMYI